MDGGYQNSSINLQQEFITAENINQLFSKYNVPDEFDLLSIDIDFNDFYVWKAISARYRPRVVVIEYNAKHLPSEDCVVLYDPMACWDKTNYFGASLLALYNLGKEKGYSLIYADTRGVNLFFLRDDLVEKSEVHFLNINDVTKIYNPPRYGAGPNGGHVQDPLNRGFIGSQLLLNQ